MLSHGRACLKRRHLPTLNNIAASPDEPLLFLYPPWFTSTVRHSRFLSSRASAPTRSLGARGPIPRASRPPRKLSFGSTSRRWISSSTSNPTEVKRTEESSKARDGALTSTATDTLADDPSKVAASLDSNVLTGAQQTMESNSRALSVETPDVKPGQASINSPSDALAVPNPNPEPSSPRLRSEKELSEDTNTVDSQPSESAEPSSYRKKPLTGYLRFSSVDQQKMRNRKHLLRRRPDLVGRMVPWSAIQNLLVALQQESSTWTKKETKQKELLVPEETLALIAGVSEEGMKGENIWYVNVRNGCRVQVLHPHESEGRYRKVIVSGSDRVIELICERINLLQTLQEKGDPMVDLRTPIAPVIPSMLALARSNITPPLIRGVWNLDEAEKKPALFHTLKPFGESLTTVREFMDYVDDLTKSKPSVSEKDELPHRKKIANALVAAFRNEAHENLYSTAALNRAISWMCEYDYLRFIKPVLYRAQHVATVDTLNIVLNSAALRQDPNMYHRYLKAMRWAKVAPNEFTWITFLDSVFIPSKRVMMKDWMLQQGYLTRPDIKRDALRVTLNETFLTHLESGRSVQSYISAIDESGVTLTASMISQMFCVISRRKHYKAMEELLSICPERNFPINNSSIYHISKLFGSDIMLFLRYLYRCSPHPELVLSSAGWETLFTMATTNRRYNLSRVLWRYACMYGGVTWRMKRIVIMPLYCNVTHERDWDYGAIWRTSSGKVTVGVDLHLSEHIGKSKLLKSLPPEYQSNPVSYLNSGFKPVGPERAAQIQFAKDLIQHDIDVGPGYRPTLPLNTMLEAAAEMDREWGRVPRPTTWLLQNAINVPVARKRL